MHGMEKIMRLMSQVSLFATLAIAAAACSNEAITFGGPLDLQISANGPVTVADSLQLDYDVVGRSLAGMVVDWGDAAVFDSIAFSGAQTAGGRVRHLYSTPGDYTVSASVVDQIEGTAVRELTVTINP